MRLTVPLVSCLLIVRAAIAADESGDVTLAQAPPAVQRTINAQIGSGKLGEITRSDDGAEATYDVDFTDAAGQQHGFDVANDGTLQSIVVNWPQVPPAVQATIKTQAVGWKINCIERDLAGGLSYDVEVSKGAEALDFTVDEDGTMVSVEVPPGDLPMAVQDTARNIAMGAKIVSAEKSLDDGDPSYDLELMTNGVTSDLTVTPDGKIVGQQIQLANCPDKVKGGIAAQVGGGVVKSIFQNNDPDGVTYDIVATTPAGAGQSFTLGPNGQLQSEEVSLMEVPRKARMTIQSQVGNGSILRIDHAFDDPIGAIIPFEVEARVAGKIIDFSVGPGGRLLDAGDTEDEAPSAAPSP